MQQFSELSRQFAAFFEGVDFPKHPENLYDPVRYFLQLGGKRMRPVACLMANELFDAIREDTWNAGAAIELFHNFTLIHDDIMDKAPLRRNQPTVHQKWNESTALLAGDVMLVEAYEYLAKIKSPLAAQVYQVFNKTAKEVCEGQQIDMDFEKKEAVSLDDYLHMINLKTSVLLGASLQLGALIGGATERNHQLLYQFGRKLGLAFQVQDDYLDAFGDPQKFGKQVGGDIQSNKKTFLWIYTYENADANEKKALQELSLSSGTEKVHGVLKKFRSCGADAWAIELKNKYLNEALEHLDAVAVISKRKQPLHDLAHYLIAREH